MIMLTNHLQREDSLCSNETNEAIADSFDGPIMNFKTDDGFFLLHISKFKKKAPLFD